MLTEALIPNIDDEQSDNNDDVNALKANSQRSHENDEDDDNDGGLSTPDTNENTQNLIANKNDDEGNGGSQTDTAKKAMDILKKVFLPEPSSFDAREGGDNMVTVDEGQAEEQDNTPSSSTSCFDTWLLDPLAVFVSKLLDLLNPGVNANTDFVKSAILLLFSIIALQVSYLTWGYLQELIMTTSFNPTDQAPDGEFPSAIFCVWLNRLVALAVSSICVSCRRTCGASGQTNVVAAQRRPPLRAFSTCAICNALSSFCQYKSIRLVSFPTMTLFKSSKIVMVMILGKLLHGTRYAWGEYVEGILITLGVVIFSLSLSPVHEDNNAIFGYVLLLAFVFFDAFNIQWQEKIYQTYGKRNVDAFQMMFGVNVFGLTFASFHLLAVNDLSVLIEFLDHNPVALTFVFLGAVASTVGQLCIFFVIQEYGSVVFIIIMTIRQMIAIFLSSIVFGHYISVSAWVGALVVFGTVSYQIRRNYTLARQPEVLLS